VSHVEHAGPGAPDDLRSGHHRLHDRRHAEELGEALDERAGQRHRRRGRRRSPSCRSRAARPTTPVARWTSRMSPSTCSGDAVVTSVLMRGRARKPSRSPPRTSRCAATFVHVSRAVDEGHVLAGLGEHRLRYSRSSRLLARHVVRVTEVTARRGLEFVEHGDVVRRSSSSLAPPSGLEVERVRPRSRSGRRRSPRPPRRRVDLGPRAREHERARAACERRGHQLGGNARVALAVDRGTGSAIRGSAREPAMRMPCVRGCEGLFEDQAFSPR